MNDEIGKRVLRLAFAIVVFSVILWVSAYPLRAQQPPAPGSPASDPNDPVNQERTNKADMRTREWLMGNSRKPIRKPGSGPEESALPQIKEDFERIQFIDREMMKSVFADNVVDNKQILKALSEIRKRASRLRTNLAYPEPNDSQVVSQAPIQKEIDIKLSLARLDQTIMSFVTNPIFQLKQQVVEAELAKKASGDLRDVVEQSDQIRKEIENLNKAGTGH
ncbi:MAG TPA: hypothetical protein VHE60_03180 [Pyrinomonadaceae bacterium]|nr:hypothetical protein [Pyrinomonadaceae bacterium]